MHVVATAGHVDHGKSTLVRALTGMEPDRYAEERRRGMTLDLGFAWTDLPSGRTVAFVDVPGHERFVPTMLAGVGPAPAVLFVVAADGGWMPQSAEHLDALDAFGVRHGLLAVTRVDLADPGPATAAALASLGRTSLGSVEAVAVSGATGAGLAGLRAALDRLVAGLPAPDPAAPVRLWVDRAFTVRGSGTVVTGTLGAGTVRAGDELALGERLVTVRGLQSLGTPVPVATGTTRLALNLRGVPVEDVARGAALVTTGAWTRASTVDVRIGRTGDLPAELVLHAGSAALPVRVRPLGTDDGPGGGIVRLTLREPLPLHVGDRLLLRDPGRRRIVAGVDVLDVAPPPLRRRGAAAARAGELAALTGGPDEAAELRRRGAVTAGALRAMGVEVRGTPVAGDWLVDPGTAEAWRAALVAAVAEHAAAHPVESGLPVEAARRRLGLPDARLVGVLAEDAGLVLRDGRVSAGGPMLPAGVRAAVAAVEADLAGAPWSAPDAGRLAELGLGRKELAAAVRAGVLLRVAEGVYLLPGADAGAAAVLAGLEQPFPMSGARQALGTSRRVAVPLLELLDARGLTERLPGDLRRVR